jgi:hypothetical protein
MNRVIFLVLNDGKPLASYDMYKAIRGIKGFRHINYRTVYRRMQVLEDGCWITQRGTRPAQPGSDSKLYALALRGKAALLLDKKSIDEFLQTATDEQLLKLIDSLG